MSLTIVPCELSEANAFVAQHHRHHRPVVGHKFSLAVSDGEAIRGVAIVGRPVARMLQDGETLEVTRVATDGAINACSALYAACWRAVRAMGYRRLVTYILAEELGTSVRAAGLEGNRQSWWRFMVTRKSPKSRQASTSREDSF